MDAEAFKQQYIPYHQKLYRIAFRLLENASDAEDVLQETYMKLWEKREELGYLENPEAFCVVLVRNRCLDILKSAKSKVDSLDVSFHDQADKRSFLSELETKQDLSIVETIISQLPEQQQMILKLRHIDEFSMEEIEQITGLSAVNIRVLLSRGRKAIREKFMELNHFETSRASLYQHVM